MFESLMYMKGDMYMAVEFRALTFNVGGIIL